MIFSVLAALSASVIALALQTSGFLVFRGVQPNLFGLVAASLIFAAPYGSRGATVLAGFSAGVLGFVFIFLRFWILPIGSIIALSWLAFMLKRFFFGNVLADFTSTVFLICFLSYTLRYFFGFGGFDAPMIFFEVALTAILGLGISLVFERRGIHGGRRE